MNFLPLTVSNRDLGQHCTMQFCGHKGNTKQVNLSLCVLGFDHSGSCMKQKCLINRFLKGKASQSDVWVKLTDIIKNKHKSTSLSSSMSSVRYQTLKYAFGEHQGECHSVSFCDVSTPDLAVEKASR